MSHPPGAAAPTPAAEAARRFLSRPGLPGTFGALMDEYARAAEDFCRAVEALPPGSLDWAQPSSDPDTTTVRAMCAHACGAARGYANAIRKARGLAYEERSALDPPAIAAPADVRRRLADALRYTEGAVEGLYEVDEATFSAIKFQVRWGPTYDPEMLIEHAIVHLLRHRRQLERWPR